MSFPATPVVQRSTDATIDAARSILGEIFGPVRERDFRVRLWDGSVEAPSADSPAKFTIDIRRPGALRRMLLPPSELAMGEAFLRGDFEVEGDLEAATGLADDILHRLRSPARLARVLGSIRTLPSDDVEEDATAPGSQAHLSGRRHSRRRDRAAVRSHYDVGNDFYALWLDRRMVYSCAYFDDASLGLDTAQEAKLDHVCRKLRLQPGERLLDIGCGWGSLVIHAAERYGVDATGITLSEPQARLARERIEAAGLADRARIEVRDYRDLPAEAQFDKIASIGMVEHVGRTLLPVYFAEAYRLLKPGGLFLNHGIVNKPDAGAARSIGMLLRRAWNRQSFIDRYVFPDGELLPVSEIVARAEGAGFETRDVEALREHYALTLRHWVHRLEAHRDEAIRLAGERTYRVWRLYMAGSAHGFASGRLSVVQTLLSKPRPGGESALPLTRADLYAG